DADAAAVIGPEGGVVAVEDTASPIYGAKIEVPAGALDEAIVLTMKPVELEQELPGNSVLAGPVVDFGPDRTQFNADVVITLPYFDEDDNGYLDATGTHEENVFPMVYNEETLAWEFPEKIDQDTNANIDRYTVAHFSDNANGGHPKVKLGVVYSLIENDMKDCITLNQEKKETCDYYKEVKDDIKNINLWIASGKKDIAISENEPVELVVQTEVVWNKSSYPNDYNYLVEYAKIIEEEKIKWTPLLGIHNIPDKLLLDEKYKDDKIAGHWLQFRPDSDVWMEVKPWVYGFVASLKEYIGAGEIIEEIFICNEMSFDKDSEYPKNQDELTEKELLEERETAMYNFLIKMRNYVIEALFKEGIKNVKVGWKYNPAVFDNFVDNRLNSKSTGLTSNMLEQLFAEENVKIFTAKNQAPSYPMILGLDIYEGRGISLDGSGEQIENFKDADTFIGVKKVMNLNNYNNVDGVYFTEYNTTNRSLFKKDELKALIINSKDFLNVPYWTYYKWKGEEDTGNEDGHITEDQVIGLCDAFDALKGLSVYERISYNNIKIIDVKKCDPYKESIKKMVGLGVISGHDGPDDQRNFKPDDLVNRAEFAKMVVETAMRLNKKFVEPANVLSYRTPFGDKVFQENPNEELWFDKYMSRLIKEGIISGYPDGFLRPGDSINMVEMLKMIVNTFQLNPNHSCKNINGEACEDSGDWWYNLFITQAKDVIKPITRGSDWVSIDIARCEGLTEEACRTLREAHPHFYLYGQKVQRRKAAKVLNDVYIHYCEEDQAGCKYCKDHPEECTLVNTEEQ
ncbi:MAG: hypothetical protein D3923_04505, partial [Candidatus Electrothrix sp. AR3]|nr:hypothetical protein [Candidatus Electrothrix sp. AR3]